MKSGTGTSGQTYWGTRDVARKFPRPLVTTIENVEECAADDDEEGRSQFPELEPQECATIKDHNICLCLLAFVFSVYSF